jgi:glycosyltransferase involved in cell wall biosynthesis
MNPGITVVILSYLRTTYLEEALDSVLDQENEDGFEVILITASEEYQPSQILFEKATKRGIPVRRIQIERVPVGEGLARAIEAARGEVITLLDDDDAWAPGKIRAVEQAFGRDDELTYFHTGQQFIDAAGRPFRPRNAHRVVRHRGSLLKEGLCLTVDTGDLRGIRALQRFEPDFNNSSIAIRRALLQRYLNQLRKVAAGEDSFLFTCALAESGHVSCCSDRLTKYRIHASTLTYPSVTLGSNLQRLDALRNYVSRHLDEAKLAIDVIGPNPRSPVRVFVRRDTAYWMLMDSILSGQTDGATTSALVRTLMASDELALRVRDGATILLSQLTRITPFAGRALLAAWRMTW